jgi:hypothetical protein
MDITYDNYQVQYLLQQHVLVFQVRVFLNFFLAYHCRNQNVYTDH